MAYSYNTMINPAIESLLDQTESKFILVTLAAKRSREINNYLGQRDVGIGAVAPPQVASSAVKPLSIALEEIAAGKIRAMPADADADPDSDPPEHTDCLAKSDDTVLASADGADGLEDIGTVD